MAVTRRAVISINDQSEVWGHGDELLDGHVWFSYGQFHYHTFRGKYAESSSLRTVLSDMARQLGYSSARLITLPKHAKPADGS